MFCLRYEQDECTEINKNNNNKNEDKQKPIKKAAQKLEHATSVVPKNNASLLNFFSKTCQKRTCEKNNYPVEIIYSFLNKRHLKSCQVF